MSTYDFSYIDTQLHINLSPTVLFFIHVASLEGSTIRWDQTPTIASAMDKLEGK